jgi:methylenetetrahydrofolate dehydrogenase (NADP+)/methenyltetrahydrofolate cyclohydrolase
MKLLNGLDLSEYIAERQARTIRGLRQAQDIQPKLAIIVTVEDPVIEIYMRLKKRYGSELLVEVDIHRVSQAEAIDLIDELNEDDTVHGIIVQLPLEDPAQTQEIVNRVAPEKDVDALGKNASHDPATPTAILWLLAGYNVDLKNMKVVLVGRGKLVGEPLERMMKKSGVDVTACDEKDDLKKELSVADIIITATGQPALITSEMVPENSVVVDAGVAVEQGVARGDLADDIYERDDLKITPKKGGVGPLTICALFENVIKAARSTADINTK